MVYLSNVVWIVELALGLNIMLVLLGITDSGSLVISLCLIVLFEVLKYSSGNFGSEPQQKQWWNRYGCEDFICEDIPSCELGDCNSQINCDNCDGLSDLNCDGISDCDCDCG